jgi:hypothetical protein
MNEAQSSTDQFLFEHGPHKLLNVQRMPLRLAGHDLGHGRRQSTHAEFGAG